MLQDYHGQQHAGVRQDKLELELSLSVELPLSSVTAWGRQIGAEGKDSVWFSFPYSNPNISAVIS